MDLKQAPLPSVIHGAVIRQAGRACFRHLVNTMPVLIHVRSGTKTVSCGETPLRLAAGDFGLLPDHLPLTMENIPPAQRDYEARVLPIPRALFEDTYARFAPITPPQTALPVRSDKLPAEAVALFDFFCSSQSIALLPPAVVTVRLMELITWFALSGAVLGRGRRLRLQDRLRHMIETDPAHDWSLGDVARAFHMSEATLRRRLAAEDTSFSETLSDARMTRALALLHTTALPIGRVAQEVGYASPSQFAGRFRDRFGVNPRDVRGPSAKLSEPG